MNDLPYAFCDAVAAIDTDLVTGMNKANSLSWGSGKLPPQIISPNVRIFASTSTSTAEIGRLTSDETELRTSRILTLRSSYNNLEPATFDEIVQILSLLSPCTNHAELFLEQFDAKNSELSKLITMLYEASFCRIDVYQWRNAYRAFLCHQMKKSKSLQYIAGHSVDVHFPKDLLARVDRFNRTKLPKLKRS